MQRSRRVVVETHDAPRTCGEEVGAVPLPAAGFEDDCTDGVRREACVGRLVPPVPVVLVRDPGQRALTGEHQVGGRGHRRTVARPPSATVQVARRTFAPTEGAGAFLGEVISVRTTGATLVSIAT